MRAAIIEGPEQIAIRDIDVPEPTAGQVRVRVEGSGVCASNIPVWEGRPWFSYPVAPGAPGHEGWGVIDALGPRPSRFHIGQRVTFLSDRAYAEYDIVDEGRMAAIPDSLDAQAVPGEPLACAVNAYTRADIRTGEWVAVVGVGFMGALLIQMAVSAGARVLAISRRPFARRLAERLGAESTLEFSDPDTAAAQAAGIVGEGMVSRVVEAVGSQEALDIATALVGVRGRLSICGYHQDGNRSVNLQLWNWRGIDVVNAHERDPEIYMRGMEQGLTMAASRTIDLGPLLTHQVRLDDLNEAFGLLRSRPDGFLKATVLM